MKRGFWIWQISECEKGDALTIAGVAKQAGLTDVFIKIADGTSEFNGTAAPRVVDALRAVGIRPWGWQYIYGTYPASEAAVAVRRIQQMGLDGFVVDAEAELKKTGERAAREYLTALRGGVKDTQIAFTSYRFPHYHPEFPWRPFFELCQINMPQVYWMQATNAGAQLQICLDKFRPLSSLPIWPIGAAFKWSGWRPTLAQIKDFEVVAKRNNLPLVSYWSWQHCRRDLPELWPVPEVPPLDLAGIERRIQSIEDTVRGVTSEIQAIRNALQGANK